MEIPSTNDEGHDTDSSTPKRRIQSNNQNVLHNMIKPLPDETAPRIAEYLGSFSVSGQTPEEQAAYVGKQLELISNGDTAKLKMVCVIMTLGGVKICDPTMKETYMSHALRRISYTTCVPQKDILAFVSRNPGEPLTNQYCHTFRTEYAAEINSIIGGAFLTAYTLKRRKKKGLSLEITPLEDTETGNNLCRHGDETKLGVLENVRKVKESTKRLSKVQSKLNESEKIEEKESSKWNPNDGLSQFESRVFAAVNERAQSRERTGSDVVGGTRSPSGRSMHRNSRRPISCHESSTKSGLKQLHQQDPPISNLRLSQDINPAFVCQAKEADVDLSGNNKVRSMGEYGKYANTDESFIKLTGTDLIGIDVDTTRSSKVGGGCSPAQALSSFFPFRLGKKKKKKYTRSKTESVLVADKTFDRLWNPSQRLSTCDNNLPLHQRTEIIPTSSMLNIGLQPRDQIVQRQLAGMSKGEDAFDILRSRRNQGNHRLSEDKSFILESSNSHTNDLSTQSPVLLSSETIRTDTTSSSSCPSSYSLSTREDSGMYTQSSNASSRSSGSLDMKNRSSGADVSLISSDTWLSEPTTSLEETMSEFDSLKLDDGILRRSFAAQLISADNFVSLDSKLMNAAWYHPALPIDVAIGILRTEQDGSFLLIRPIRKGASYTLVVSCRGSCKIFNINKIEKVGYHVEGRNQFFPHVYILIAQYSCHPGPMPFKLKTMQLCNPLYGDKLE